MANTHTQFQDYNNLIKLNETDRAKLITARNSLRQRMKVNYLLIPIVERNNIILDFQSQGSFVMDTIIKPIVKDYDLDDGVYFQGNLNSIPQLQPKVLHNWVVRAVNNNDDYETIKDKATCVRVQYKQKFHIDLPIYFADNFNSPYLAETNKGWILSNPVELIAWFEEKAKSGFKREYLIEAVKYAEPYERWLGDIRKADCQLRRIVRYMKAWADLKSDEMPCGLIMTILVANNYVEDSRDDIAFYNTISNIRKYLISNGFKCPRPTTPINEDLFATTSENHKQFFMKALVALIHSAHTAISNNDVQEACKELSKHLGTRFSCQSAISSNTSIQSPASNIEALKRTAVASTPWSPKR